MSLKGESEWWISNVKREHIDAHASWLNDNFGFNQASPNVFLNPFSTGAAGIKRRNLAKSDASPLGVWRIFHAPKEALTIVSATWFGIGAFCTLFWIAFETILSSLL